MKKFITLLLSSCMIISLVGCGNTANNEEETTAIVEESNLEEEEEYTPIEEKVHTVRVNGINYFETNRTTSYLPEVTEDTITGDIRSFVAKDEFPTEDNQSNFGVGYVYQVKDKDFVYVNINDAWHIFCSNEDGKNVITFQDRVFMKTELSKETLEWLEKYNELSIDEQLAMDAIPAELIDEVDVQVEDAEDIETLTEEDVEPSGETPEETDNSEKEISENN